MIALYTLLYIGSQMSILQQVIIVVTGVLATMLTRFIPFLIFRPGKPTPRYIQYLGKVLPASVFALLVVYCLKNISFVSTIGNTNEICGIPSDTIAQLLGVIFTILIHFWRKSMMWSIAAGTIFYMIVIRII